jgi:hypothetical protein
MQFVENASQHGGVTLCLLGRTPEFNQAAQAGIVGPLIEHRLTADTIMDVRANGRSLGRGKLFGEEPQQGLEGKAIRHGPKSRS